MTYTDKSYKIVRTQEDVNELLAHIQSFGILALDTETSSLNPRKGDLVGWSVSGEIGKGYYIPTLIFNPATDMLEDLYINGKKSSEISKKLLILLKGKKLIFHNASFDVQYIKNQYGIDFLSDIWIDTMLLVHTVNEEGAFGFGSPFGLKSIAQQIQAEIGLDISTAANQEQVELKESIKANGGSVTKENFEIFKADADVLGKYAAADVDLTLRIADHYMKILKEEGLEKFFFEDEVMPLYKEVTIPMEMYGVAMNIDLLYETKDKIERDLEANKQVVLKSILSISECKNWIVDTSLAKFPPSNRGSWAQKICSHLDLPFGKSAKTNKYSINKSNIDKLEDGPIKTFLRTGDMNVLDPSFILKISTDLWKEFNDGEYVNIQSKKHLSEIVFKYMGVKPITKTAKGGDQFDLDLLEHLSKKYEWAENLRVYSKLQKIKTTYVDRFLEKCEDGRWYPYFKQHGTVSGRYGSDVQQLPKPKEEDEDSPIIVNYNNMVRSFFVSEPGRVFIDTDYQSLEPRVFCSVTEDPGLQEIFSKGWDFYSTIAIKTEKLDQQKDKYPNGVSPDTKAPNFLKKLDPVKRNQAKAYSLGLAYGMGPYALGKTLNIPQADAEVLYNGYLNGFPGLKNWINTSRAFVIENGYIKNKVGRIRHLPEVRNIHHHFQDKLMDPRFRRALFEKYDEDKVMNLYRDYKNGLNNTLNFQIQSLAASIVNRAALCINRKFKQENIDGLVVAQIHDQLICNVNERDKERACSIIQDCMENTTKLTGVELIAVPEIGTNWRDTH